MAFNHSKLSYFQTDDASNTLRNITAYLTSVELPEELELIDTTTMGATSKTYVIGFADAKISYQGYWDPTLDGYLSGLKAAFRDGTLASASWVYGPAGSTSGYVKFSGEYVMTSYKKSNEIKGVTEFMVEGQVTGNVTVGTF